MVKVAAALAAVLPLATAWSTAMGVNNLVRRAGSTGRLNSGGGHPHPTFNEDQFVDVRDSSANPFKAPGNGDLRGECPGLNAAANHGFLPRNGKPTIAQTITGLGDLYNMSPDLAAALAAISVLLSGDIPTMTWSIGGSFPASLPLLGTPYGILGTHDSYEGDASVCRGDAYLNGGDVDVFQMRSWNVLYQLASDGNFGMDDAAAHSNYVTDYSIQNNPYYFSGPLSGLVAPAASNFLPAFMSNHSAEQPGGYLTVDHLKSFFSVTGDSPNFVFTKFQERVPLNWYKRQGGTGQYSLADVDIDLLAGASIYPDTLRIGGNTGTTNSFTGVDISNFTGGVLNGQTLFTGNNLICFATQAAAIGRTSQLSGVAGILGSSLTSLTSQISGLTAGLSCPQISNFGFDTLNMYPGYKYDNPEVGS